MKKYSRMACVLLCICILMNGTQIQAADGANFEGLKTAYQEKDISYKRSMLNLQQQLFKYNLAEVSLEEGLTNGLGDAKMAELELQKDLLSFYPGNETLLVKQMDQNLEYQMKKQLLQLKLLKEQQKYYNTYATYLNVLYRIEDVKYKRGRSTKEEIDDINVRIVKNHADLEGVLADYQDGQEKVGVKTAMDNYVTQLSLDIVPRHQAMTVNTLIATIKSNNGEYIQLENTVAGYEKYLDSFAADTGSLSYQQGMLQLSDGYLQLMELEEDIASYAKSVISGYKKTVKKQNASALSLAVLSKKRVNVAKQYEKGRGALLACYEAQVKEETERQNYYSLCYQLMIWEEILDKGIYDKTL